MIRESAAALFTDKALTRNPDDDFLMVAIVLPIMEYRFDFGSGSRVKTSHPVTSDSLVKFGS